MPGAQSGFCDTIPYKAVPKGQINQMKRLIVITIGLLVVLASLSMAYLVGAPADYELHFVPLDEMKFGKYETVTIYDGTYGRRWTEPDGTVYEIGPIVIEKHDPVRLTAIRKR